jgi:hypothetical protein
LTVQADGLDHGQDLWLRTPQANRRAADTEAASEHGQVKHHRRIGERQLTEVNDDIGLSADGTRQRRAPDSLRRPVLVPAAAQGCGGVIEIDDRGNLYKPTGVSSEI